MSWDPDIKNIYIKTSNKKQLIEFFEKYGNYNKDSKKVWPIEYKLIKEKDGLYYFRVEQQGFNKNGGFTTAGLYDEEELYNSIIKLNEGNEIIEESGRYNKYYLHTSEKSYNIDETIEYLRKNKEHWVNKIIYQDDTINFINDEVILYSRNNSEKYTGRGVLKCVLYNEIEYIEIMSKDNFEIIFNKLEKQIKIIGKEYRLLKRGHIGKIIFNNLDKEYFMTKERYKFIDEIVEEYWDYPDMLICDFIDICLREYPKKFKLNNKDFIFHLFDGFGVDALLYCDKTLLDDTSFIELLQNEHSISKNDNFLYEIIDTKYGRIYIIEDYILGLNEEMQKDKQVVQEILKINGKLIEYFNEDVIFNKENLMIALEQNSYAMDFLKIFKYLIKWVEEYEDLRNDYELGYKAVIKNSENLEHFRDSKFYNKEFIMDIIKNIKWTDFTMVIVHLNDDLKEDEELVLEILKYNASEFIYLSDKLKRNEEFISKALSVNPLVSEYIEDKKDNNDDEIFFFD